MYGSSTIQESITGSSSNISILDSASADFVTPFDSFVNVDSGASVEVLGIMRSGGQVEGAVGNFLGFEHFTSFSGEVRNYTYVRGTPSFSGDVQGIIGFQFSPSGPAQPQPIPTSSDPQPFSAVVGYVSNMGGIDASLTSFGKPIAYQATGGITFFQSEEVIEEPPTGFLPFQFGNIQFRGLYGEQNVTADSAGSVDGMNILIDDNVEITTAGFNLGLTNKLQFTGVEMAGSGGANIERLAGFTSVLLVEEPVDSDDNPVTAGGTIQSSASFRVVGIINPDGVSGVDVEEYTAFLWDPIPFAPNAALESWGIRIRETAHNFFAGDVVVGGSLERPSNESIAIEVADKRALKLTPMTESERDLLDTTDGAGMVALVEDGSSSGLQFFNGFEWIRGSNPSVLWFSIPSDVTLNETHSTRTAFLTGDAVVTLPEWSSVSDGYVVEIVTDGSPHTATFATQGGDTIRGGRTQINGDCSVIRSPQAGLWITVGEVTEP